ncbi:MAG: DNA gyrase subunit B [Fimbriimonadales bacterium]
MTALPDDAENAKNEQIGERSAGTDAAADSQLDTHAEESYTARDLEVLQGLEGVRLRPSMYIGDPNIRGLHQLFNEVVDNAVDEALAGFCDRIEVTLIDERTCSVRDNGRGFPIDIHEETGLSGLETVMTMLHAGGKFGGRGYKVSSGLHGVGVSVVNALSKWLEVEVCRDGALYKQRYERGVTVTPLKKLGKCRERGSLVTWSADETIFKEHCYDPKLMLARIRDLAYLNPKLTFVWHDKLHGEEPITIRHKRGISELVEHLNEGKDVLHKVVYFSRTRDDVEIEVALQYHDSYSELILTFANNINTTEGGTHLSGFKTALTRVINAYARKTGMLKDKDLNLTGDDVRDGLTAVLSVKLASPQFEAQTKIKLTNFEVEGLVNSTVGEAFGEFLDENPSIARKIVEKGLVARRAREAARHSAELVRRQSGLEHLSMPGKLVDCIERDPSLCELFLVEGKSAGGSAKEGRDRRTQALLPLRGKILNVERARIDKALANEEIRCLITVLGTGIANSHTSSNGEEEDPQNGSFDLKKLRYHKIIIMTDADVDGEHIRTLLLTFFYRYMRPLLEAGHVYIAQPPLFCIRAGKDERYYAASEEDRDAIVKSLRAKNKTCTVSRFKGLGEMNGQELFETTMDPESRTILRVQYDPEVDSESAEEIFSKLMGDKVEPRRAFIERHAKEITDIDWDY